MKLRGYSTHQNDQSSCPHNAPNLPLQSTSSGQVIMGGRSLLSAQSVHAVVFKAAVFPCPSSWSLYSTVQWKFSPALSAARYATWDIGGTAQTFLHILLETKTDGCTQKHKEELNFWTCFKPQVTLNLLESRIENTSRTLSPH